MQQSRKVGRGHLRLRSVRADVGGKREVCSAFAAIASHRSVTDFVHPAVIVFLNHTFKVILYFSHPPIIPFQVSSHVMIGKSVQEKTLKYC